MNDKEFVNETLSHIRNVGILIGIMISDLTRRMVNHDSSKLQGEEYDGFLENTHLLRGLTYGSPEYKKTMEAMQSFIKIHYAKNRHHPENHRNGIKDMTLVDLIEMLSDWKAATLRHADGNILKSIDIQQEKLGFSDDLKQILLNTVKQYMSNGEVK